MYTGWWFQPPTPLKKMTSSVGIMTFLIYGKIKIMFQTTNRKWVWKRYPPKKRLGWKIKCSAQKSSAAPANAAHKNVWTFNVYLTSDVSCGYGSGWGDVNVRINLHAFCMFVLTCVNLHAFCTLRPPFTLLGLGLGMGAVMFMFVLTCVNLHAFCTLRPPFTLLGLGLGMGAVMLMFVLTCVNLHAFCTLRHYVSRSRCLGWVCGWVG